MNILLKEIFAGIFVSIACWNCHYDFLESSDKSSKFNSFAFTHSAVLYLHVIGGTNFSFIDEWREYISRVFNFCVWDLTREIRENKNPAKISTYTVLFTHMQTSNPYGKIGMCNSFPVLLKKCITLRIMITNLQCSFHCRIYSWMTGPLWLRTPASMLIRLLITI